MVRATDSGPLQVDDTLVVTVNPVNDPPVVASAMPDTTVNEDNATIVGFRDLNDVFSDADDGIALNYTIQSNTNAALVIPTINGADSTLELAFGPELSGSATIVVRATDSGALTVDDTLVVTVNPINDTPVVTSAIPDTTVGENNPPVSYRDLNDVFDDIEDSGALAFSIESNDNPGLVTATATGGGSGGVTFRSVSTAGTGAGGTSINVNKPTGTVAGDLLIASFGSDGNRILSPPDASWVLIEGGDGNPLASTPGLGVWYKIAGGAEPSLYTFTSDSGSRFYIALLRYDGHDPASPIHASAIANSAGSTTPTSPDITTTVDGCKILRLFGADDDDTPYTVPVGHTERYNGVSGTGIPTTGGAGADADQATAGSTGTAQFTMNASEEWRAATIAHCTRAGEWRQPASDLRTDLEWNGKYRCPCDGLGVVVCRGSVLGDGDTGERRAHRCLLDPRYDSGRG